MRKLIIALLLVLCAPAFAQVPMTGAGKAKPASAPPLSISYVSNASVSGSGSDTITATGLDFGSVYSTRRVLIVMSGGFGTLSINNGASTIGTTTATAPDDSGQCVASGGGVSIWWASAVVTGGTTSQDVSLKFSGTNFTFGVMAVYVMDNASLSSITPVTGSNTVSAATTASATVATLSGGGIISTIYTASGTTSETISTSTASLSVDAANVGGSAGFGHANSTGAVGSSNVTWTWSTSSDAGVCNFAYR